MALNSCRLSEPGERARNELLALVYPDGYNSTTLHRDTGLEYGKTIPKILGKKDGGIQLEKLKLFFKKLLEQLIDRYNDDDVSKYICDYKLAKFCQDISNNESDLSLPKDLYRFLQAKSTTQLRNSRSPSKSLGFGNIIQQNRDNQRDFEKVMQPQSLFQSVEVDMEKCRNLIDLLRYLDYRQQESDFKSALESHDKCLSFSVVAPCDITQKWILNRLLKQITSPGNGDKLLMIDLRKDGIRNDFQEFLNYLRVGSESIIDIELILTEICQVADNSSVIITINQFRNFKAIQENIIRLFWEPLCKKISNQRRTRVIMFWVDECYPCYDSDDIIKLNELTEISQVDVERWINRYSCDNQYRSCLFSDHLLEYNFSNRVWDWQDPVLVLDNICQEFKLTGVADIEKLWEWTL